MSGMNMGYYGPSGLPEQSHEPACRFLGVATALCLQAHHPGNLGRTGSGTARRHRHLHCPHRETGLANPHHPVPPQLLPVG